MKIKRGNASQEKSGFTVVERLQSLAYRLIGSKISRFLPLFQDLDLHLERAGLKTNFRVYVSLTLFFTV
ncbi:MAG: hypothetical protein QXJ63_03085, partial [Candidatus Bathyarchaeia archaeon]